MKKTYFALIACALAFAVHAAPNDIPDQFVGSYVGKGEKCDRKADGTLKAKDYLLVTKKEFEMGYMDIESGEGESDSYNCSPNKAVTVKGDSVTFPASCQINVGVMKKSFRLTKTAKGIGFTAVSDKARMVDYLACPAK
jgi:hypothetical protein